MEDFQSTVLRAVKQLKEADIRAISNLANLPPSVVKGVCSYLTRYGYLAESQGTYKVAWKGTRALYDKEREIEVK